MQTVLVTGGTGVLGRELVPRLTGAGYKARIMSRRAGESNVAGDVEWAQADLASGEGLEAAVQGIDAILHAASSPFKDTKETDVDGTRRLIEAGKTGGVSHFYYISIVGIDKIASGYYKAKLATEAVVENGGVPYTILRATQFHSLLDTFLKTLFRRGPFLFLPGAAKFQLIDAGEVAEHMVQTLADGPFGRLADIGGPEVLTAKEIARDWMAARGKKLTTIPVPAVGFLSGFAKGYNCCPENRLGKITWKQWLAAKYGDSS
jgi:uncharacterized protein YbjT (DUF2867 family)